MKRQELQILMKTLRKMNIRSSAVAETLTILSEGDRTMSAVAGELGLTSAGLTTLADRLEARGWVERYRVTGDRRKIYLRLTEAGRALVEGGG